ncbi:MAG: metallophosphoesterase [Rhodospirillales bacterium]
MKCLLLSDLHYALPQFDWALAQAAKFDLVVIAGDHLDISGHVDCRAQTTVILAYLRRLKARVPRLIVSSGNHDLDSVNAAGEKVPRWMERVRAMGIPTDGDSVPIGDALFTVCPWWDGPVTRAAVGRQLAADAAKEKRRWVWVYHAPPAGSPTCRVGDRLAGDADLVAWIEAFQPDMVLTGHIHEAPFARGGSWIDRIGRTWVFNAGRQIGPEPCHVVWDTDEDIAMWFSLMGAETIRLDAPLVRPLAALTALPGWLRDRPQA